MRFWHSYTYIGRHNATPDILFVNFLITSHDNVYVHVNVRYQFGSFMIHNFFSHIRNMQLKNLSSENDLGLLINRKRFIFRFGYLVNGKEK